MREIKFRAWDITNKRMQFEIDLNSAGIPFSYENNGACGSPECCGPYEEWLVEHDEWKVMQYTSLKDKNGKEIYEGDIVTFDEDTIAEVFWDEKSVGWSWRWGKYRTGMINDSCEVIGNIYENKELLK